jgi:carbonic anhydrase/acetyltransferase-like protein (isoleucine patch superfamily)
MLYKYKQHTPDIDKAAFIAESAEIGGEVYAEEDSSIWFHVSIRGDLAPVYIGKGSNVQDNSAVHVSDDIPTKIGKNVTIGHSAVIHSCTIGDNCLVGMGAIVLDGAEIGEGSIIGAGALVTQNKKFPPRSLLIGSPAKVARELTQEEIAGITHNAEEYIELAKNFSSSERYKAE